MCASCGCGCKKPNCKGNCKTGKFAPKKAAAKKKGK